MGVTNFPNGLSAEGDAVVATPAANVKIACGSQSVTGTAEIVTGIGTVVGAVATLETIAAGVGDPAVVTAVPSATAGSIDVTVKQDDHATNATVAVVVNWVAFGTG